MRMVTVSSAPITTQGSTSISPLPANDSQGRPEILAVSAAPRTSLLGKASPSCNPPPTAVAVMMNSLRFISRFVDMLTSKETPRLSQRFERRGELSGGCADTCRRGHNKSSEQGGPGAGIAPEEVLLHALRLEAQPLHEVSKSPIPAHGFEPGIHFQGR